MIDFSFLTNKEVETLEPFYQFASAPGVASADVDFVIPRNFGVLPLTIYTDVTTDANVGNRFISIRVYLPNNQYICSSVCQAPIVAGQTAGITFSVTGESMLTSINADVASAKLAETILYESCKIQLHAEGTANWYFTSFKIHGFRWQKEVGNYDGHYLRKRYR